MKQQELEQLFENNSNCWAARGQCGDKVTDDDILDTMAMDKAQFVQVVTDLLHEEHKNGFRGPGGQWV